MFPAEPQQCIQHLTLGWEWYHQPFNVEIPSTSCHTKNSEIPFKEILPFSVKIHKVNVEKTFPTAWKHPLPKANSFSWQRDSFFMIAVTAFFDNWDNLFRIAVTADPAAWALLIFSPLAKTKTKTNYWDYLSLAKIPSFLCCSFPSSSYPKKQKYLKAKHTIFGQILRWILWRFIAV